MTFRLFTAGLLVTLLAPFGVVPVSAQDASTTSTVPAAVAFLQDRSVTDLDRLNDVLTIGEAIRIAFDARTDSKDAVVARRSEITLPAFSDISIISPFAAYARVALEEGLIARNIDRTLRPNTSIRTEEAIALLMREKRGTGNDWYVSSIRDAIGKNIIADARSLSIGGMLTRGQYIDMVYRLETVRDNNLVAFSVQTEQKPMLVASKPVTTQKTDTPVARITVDPSVPPVLAAAEADEHTRMVYGSAKYFSISIPSLNITDLTVTHPEDSVTRDGLLSVLDRGVGHLYSYPGKGGKIMIYGHSSDYAWINTPYTEIFSTINQLHTGDKIYVTYDGKTYTYSVQNQEVIDPDDTSAFQGDGEELILYTCWPPKSVKERLIVRAVPDQTVEVR
jgi:LPXTG-site transpeptidase (sortase) family protein